MRTHRFLALAALVLGIGLSGAAVAAETALRVGTWALPPGRGNPYTGLSTPQTFTWSAIFDALTAIDAEGKAMPALAQSWSNTGPTTWEVKLRPGITFHNGVPLTAAAFVTSFDWLRSDLGKAQGATVASRMAWLAKATANDDLTLVLETARPDPIVPNELAVMAVIEPKAWTDLEAFAAHPVGTGSYRLESFDSGVARLTAYEESWRKPRMAALEIHDMPDRAARLQAFLSGQLDIVLGLSPDNISNVKDAGARIDAQPGPQVLTWSFTQVNAKDGVDVAPFQDRRVRLALNLAVNRQAIVDNLLLGVGGIAVGQGLSPVVYGYAPDVEPYPYDPKKARSLLGEAGYRDLAFEVAVVPGAFPADAEIFQQVAADLGKIGVDVTLKTITFPEWRKNFFPVTWDVPVWHNLWMASPTMDATAAFVSQSCGKGGKPYLCDPEQQALLDEIATEFDEEKRLAKIHELVRLQHDEAVNLFLFAFNSIHAYSSEIGGYRNVNQTLLYHEMFRR